MSGGQPEEHRAVGIPFRIYPDGERVSSRPDPAPGFVRVLEGDEALLAENRRRDQFAQRDVARFVGGRPSPGASATAGSRSKRRHRQRRRRTRLRVV